MMLSYSEAEGVALSYAIKEVMFMIHLLESMKFSVKLLVTARVNNVVAIFKASNISTKTCTKHVGIRYKYVTEYVDDREVTNYLC